MPFGEVCDITGSQDPITQTDFGYTGQRNLGGMGLMDYRARFYSPLLGRFTQPDTLVSDPLNLQGFNRYAYALNNPIIYSDPSGHSVFNQIGKFISGAVYQLARSTRDSIPIPATAAQMSAVESMNDEYSSSFQAGRIVGALAATAVGVVEIITGVGGMGGGVVTCGTGVLCPGGVAVAVASATLVTHGASMVASGFADTAELLFNASKSRRSLDKKKSIEKDLDDGPTFPEDPNEFSEMVGQEPDQFYPDGDDFIGRNKKKWHLKNGITVTHEAHTYHPDAPPIHKNPHYHVDSPTYKHKTFAPGDKIPFKIYTRR